MTYSVQVDINDVARVYNESLDFDHKPLVYVAKRFGVSQSTAARRVAEARQLGLIAPVTAGSQGISPRVVSVAKELGVDPRRLRDVIRAHGGRVTS